MKESLKTLESKLRDLIDIDRAQLVEYYVRTIRAGVEKFLELRKPNKSPYDVYQSNEQPLGIMEATNYIEAIKSLGWEGNNPVGRRPAFEVAFKPDADEIIQGIAEKEVEFMVQTFVSRSMSKLGPVVERKGSWTTERVGAWGGFQGGAWVGFIKFSFDDGVNFVADLKIITNFSKYGRPYGQYPLTFQDVVLDPASGVQKKRASVEQVWASVGYVPPPPVKRKRWAKLIKGSVVMHEGRPYMVLSPGKAKKAGIPADAEQIARLSWQTNSGRIERADTISERWMFPEDLKAECIRLHHECKWDESDKVARDATWKHFFPDGHEI